MEQNVSVDNEKLVKEFGASPISKMQELPDFYTFNKGLVYSHREFDKFMKALKKGEKCAIVSGVNASGTLHTGHMPLFDTLLYFQKEFNVPLFIPISDDESYVSGKVENQEQGIKYSIELAKEFIAYGFNPKSTFFIIDNFYTNIYNLAIKLSKKINVSEVKSTYGYKSEDNIGLHFYPSVQAAHVLFPQTLGIKNVLVPIGPDEDAHLRICRDVAPLFGFEKPSIIHFKFLEGTDGEKMSKSRNNAIFLKDSAPVIKKKVMSAFSGGQKTLEEHKKLGGNPDIDVSYKYLSYFFLDEKQSNHIYLEYKAGRIMSGELKQQLNEKLSKKLIDFQEKLAKVSDKDVEKCLLKNDVDLKKLLK